MAESSTGKCPWTKDELLEMLLESDLGKMEIADEQELFDRWAETEDRLEYIALTMKLFPKVNREKSEKMADELNLQRRCFENDERIKERGVLPMDYDGRQGGASSDDAHFSPGNQQGRSGETG